MHTQGASEWVSEPNKARWLAKEEPFSGAGIARLIPKGSLQEKKEASTALFCCISNPRPQNTLVQNNTPLASSGFDLLHNTFKCIIQNQQRRGSWIYPRDKEKQT